MSHPLLPREIDAIIDLATLPGADLLDPDRRALLLAGLAPRVAGSLTKFATPTNQLQSDLILLNNQGVHTPDGGQNPLSVWLANAAGLTAHLPGVPDRFHEWRARLTRPPRMLALSFNADAQESSRVLWHDQIPPDRIWHLDLRAHATGLRTQPEGIRAAWIDLAQQVKALGIPDHQGPIELANRAVSALVVWLGWRLYRLRAFTGYNFFTTPPTPFRGPLEVVRPPAHHQAQALRVTSHPPEQPREAPEAVIIIDLLGKAPATDLEKFPEPVRSLSRRLLVQRTQTGPVGPSETTPILTDLVALFAQLRHEEHVNVFHVGFLVPDVLAFFLGQQLHECGVFHLYEHYTDEAAYKHALSLTDAPARVS